MKSIPYTYLIGWSLISKYYYGVRYSKDCHPNDLWVTYFTSSNLVKDLQQQHGDPDIIQIRRTFISRESAILWEQKVLRRMKVLDNVQWVNQNIAGAINIVTQSIEHVRKRTQNKKHNPRQREIALMALQKAIASNTGRKQSEETQRKKRETYKNNIDKNKISARRESWCHYLIDGEIYKGNKAVMKAFAISEPTIYNRVKSFKYDWKKIDGK